VKVIGNSILSENENIRMILTVNDPDIVFANALKAGAKEVFPIGEINSISYSNFTQSTST
jgi:hypothetical protein